MNMFSPDYPHHFTLFGTAHVAAMIGFAALWIAVPVALRNGVSEAADRRIRYGAAGVLVGQLVVWMVWEAVTGRFTLQQSLPLNLCDATVFLLAALLVTQNRRLFEVLYFWALAGTIQSFVTPNVTFAFPHLEFWVFYLQHGLEILVILYFVFVLKFRPYLFSTVRSYGWLLVFIAAVYLFNMAAGSNYMFLMADTPQPSTVTRMIALFGAPPRHMIGLGMVALASVVVLYLPWLIVDARQRRRQRP